MGGLEGCRSRGEGCTRKAGHVGVARAIHGNTSTRIPVAATQVGGVDQDRVDDKRHACIISRYLKADLILTFEHIPRGNLPFYAAHFLVNERFA